MAFGEEKHKKTTFEKVTLIIVVLMVLATVAGLVLPAISALMQDKTLAQRFFDEVENREQRLLGVNNEYVFRYGQDQGQGW